MFARQLNSSMLVHHPLHCQRVGSLSLSCSLSRNAAARPLLPGTLDVVIIRCYRTRLLCCRCFAGASQIFLLSFSFSSSSCVNNNRCFFQCLSGLIQKKNVFRVSTPTTPLRQNFREHPRPYRAIIEEQRYTYA